MNMKSNAKSARLKKLLLSLPGVLLLIIVVAGIWAVATGRLDGGGDPRAEHVAAFMVGLQDGSLEAAYQRTTPEFRRRVPFSLFKTTIERHDVLRSFHGGELRFVLVGGSRGWSAVSSGKVSTPAGDVPVEVQLEKSAMGNYYVADIVVRGVPVFPAKR